MTRLTRRIALALLLAFVGVAAWRAMHDGQARPEVAASVGANGGVRPMETSPDDRKRQPARAKPNALRPATTSGVSDPAAADEAWREFKRVRQCIELLMLETQLNIHAGEDADAPRTFAHAAARMAEALAAVHGDCTNVKLDMREIQGLLKRAAELGSIDARIAYAASPELVETHRLAEPEAWRHWRDRAPGYLDEAIAGGHGEAAMLKGLASMRRDCHVHGGIDGRDGDDAICHRTFPLNAILPRDDVVAYAHLLLAQELGVGENAAELEAAMTALAAHMTAQQRAQAEQVAQTLRGGNPR